MGVQYNRKYTPEVLSDYADKLIAWADDEKNLWLGDFAKSIGVDRNRLSDWPAKSEKFAAALKYAKSVQEARIVTGALTGRFNAFFAFNTLKNVAGWRDKHDITVDGSKDFKEALRSVDVKKLKNLIDVSPVEEAEKCLIDQR